MTTALVPPRSPSHIDLLHLATKQWNYLCHFPQTADITLMSEVPTMSITKS